MGRGHWDACVGTWDLRTRGEVRGGVWDAGTSNIGDAPGAKKGFVNGEALRLLRTNSSIKTFEENITTFKKHLLERGYAQNLIKNTLSEVKFQERTQALLQQISKKS